MPAALPEGQVTDQNPIINDPYGEPTRQWQFGEGAPAIDAALAVVVSPAS